MKIKMVGKLLLNRWRRIWEVFQFLAVSQDTELTFFVVSAQYNSGEATLKCLDSVYNQRLPRERVKHIFIDDASTDSTPELIQNWLDTHPDHNVEYIRNEKNMNICYNLHTAFSRAPAGSISMQLDGDDWLADEDALGFLAKVYSNKDVWVTFNTWISSDKKQVGQTRRIADKTIQDNSIRKAPWVTGHLKTFRSEIYKHVPKSYMLDPRTGYWWSSSADQAFFLAVLELAGKHIYHVHRILQIYYIREHTNDNAYTDEQEDCRRAIRELEPLSPLVRLD